MSPVRSPLCTVVQSKLADQKRRPVKTSRLDVSRQDLRTQGCYPNTSIAYRILFIMPMTVASTKRCFSK
jgi:hypothetical protein